jgi:hypothetical protein
VCNSKIEKNKINVQIKKIEHGIANIFYFFRFYYVHAVLTTTNTEVGVKKHQKKKRQYNFNLYKDGIHPGDLLAKAWLCKIEEQAERLLDN